MSAPVTNRPASRSPVAAPKSAPKQPAPAPKPADTAADYRKRRDESAFQGAVARMPSPGVDERALSPSGAKTLESVQRLLSGVVTDGHAKEALTALGTLAPRDFKLVMEKLGASGGLESLLSNLPAGGRSQFLSLAAAKGWVRGEAGKPNPTTKFDPPAGPTLYRMEPRLPACVNDAIFAESKSVVAKYRADFNAYLGRYEAAVKNTTSTAELAALGHPAQPSSDRLSIEPGLANEAQYRRDFGKQYASRDRAYDAVSRRVSELTHERHDGAAWLEVNVELLPKDGPAVAVKVDDQGVEVKKGVTMSGEAGGVEGRVTCLDGEVAIKGGAGPGELEVKVKNRKLTEVSGKVDGPVVVEVGLERDGKATFGLGGKAESGHQAAEVGVFTTVSPKDAELTAGISGEVKVNGHEAKVKVSVGYKGSPRSTGRDVATGRSVLDR